MSLEEMLDQVMDPSHYVYAFTITWALSVNWRWI